MIKFVAFVVTILFASLTFGQLSPMPWTIELRKPNAAEILELEDDQIVKLKRAFVEVEKRRKAGWKTMLGKFPDGIKTLSFAEKIEATKLARQAQKKLAEQHQQETRMAFENVVSEEQFKRLKQLSEWGAINRFGFSTWLLSEETKSALDIEAEQEEKIRKLTENLNEQFAKEVFELRRNYRLKLKKKLSAETQKNLKLQSGEPSMLGAPKVKF